METIFECVDGPAAVLRGRVLTPSAPIRIVQQSQSYGRFLFRPMTVIENCVFRGDGASVGLAIGAGRPAMVTIEII